MIHGLMLMTTTLMLWQVNSLAFVLRTKYEKELTSIFHNLTPLSLIFLSVARGAIAGYPYPSRLLLTPEAGIKSLSLNRLLLMV